MPTNTDTYLNVVSINGHFDLNTRAIKVRILQLMLQQGA